MGGRDRGWPDGPGNPVASPASVPLRDVREHPAVRVLGYQPEYDEDTGRWFVDVALQETPALWPFVRLAVARYQPHSIEGCSLSPVALTSWVQPLPTRTLTVSRPDAGHVQVTLTGRRELAAMGPAAAPGLPGEQLSADSPTGDAATRAARLQQSRTVRGDRPAPRSGGRDLEWETVSTSLLLAVSVEESGGFRATWSGSVVLPSGVGTPGLRRPGWPESLAGAGGGARAARRRSGRPGRATPVPRLVYAGQRAVVATLPRREVDDRLAPEGHRVA